MFGKHFRVYIIEATFVCICFQFDVKKTVDHVNKKKNLIINAGLKIQKPT
mgnify:CR=1 FL=1